MKLTSRFIGTSQYPYGVHTPHYPNFTNEMIEWCQEQYGCPYNNIGNLGQWIREMDGVRFKKEQHRTWFIMRWS
jgi:hypothetical protein